jgi:hypothetical protein
MWQPCVVVSSPARPYAPRAAGAPGRAGGTPPTGPGGRPPRRRSALQRFVARHGWRAYALPILIVLTVVALVTTVPGKQRSTSSGAPGDSPSTTVPQNTPGTQTSARVKIDTGEGAESLPGDALPPGEPFVQKGKGTFRVLAGSSPKVGHGTLVTYAIEVENGITGVDLDQFARTVVSTLSDSRSWTAGDSVTLQRVSSAQAADVRVVLTTPMTVRTICGYDIKIETSCRQAYQGTNFVALNLARWVRGDVQFGQDLTTYRLYMVNHEFGHAIGHNHSFTCLPNGMAPVMMQQTITLREDQGKGKKICQPNAWPYPPGVAHKDAVTT